MHRIRPLLCRASVSLALALTTLAAPAGAQVSVPVVNPGFEDPAIAAGTFLTTAAPPGWSVYGSGIDFGFRTIGVLDPTGTTLYPGGAPEGENVGVVFLLDDPADQASFAGIEAGMEQTLTTPLEPNTRYELRVRVGNIADDAMPPNDQFEFAGFPGYRVELLAGGVPLADDGGALLPPEGAFRTTTVRFEVGPAHALEGQMLGVRLVNRNAAPGIEVNFDDVRLESRRIVPETGLVPLVLPGMLVILLGVARVPRGR